MHLRGLFQCFHSPPIISTDSGGEIREENTLTPRKVSIFPDGRNAVQFVGSLFWRAGRGGIVRSKQREAHQGGRYRCRTELAFRPFCSTFPAWATSDPRESAYGRLALPPNGDLRLCHLEVQ